MISLNVTKEFSTLPRLLNKYKKLNFSSVLHNAGKAGVAALSAATPTDTGKTASEWRYEVKETNGKHTIVWHNDNINDGVSIAVLLQYGHGTGTGGYVPGTDYINPALAPVMKDLEDKGWKAVTNV